MIGDGHQSIIFTSIQMCVSVALRASCVASLLCQVEGSVKFSCAPVCISVFELVCARCLSTMVQGSAHVSFCPVRVFVEYSADTTACAMFCPESHI